MFRTLPDDEDLIFSAIHQNCNSYDGKETRLKLLSVPYHSVLLRLLQKQRQAYRTTTYRGTPKGDTETIREDGFKRYVCFKRMETFAEFITI